MFWDPWIFFGTSATFGTFLIHSNCFTVLDPQPIFCIIWILCNLCDLWESQPFLEQFWYLASFGTKRCTSTGSKKRKVKNYRAITQLENAFLALYMGSYWSQVRYILLSTSIFSKIALKNLFWHKFIHMNLNVISIFYNILPSYIFKF